MGRGEIDCDPARVHHIHVVTEAWCAPSASHESVAAAAHFNEGFALYGAERIFASAREYLLDAASLPLFDIIVKIDEAHSCVLCHGSAKSGLAAAHISY